MSVFKPLWITLLISPISIAQEKESNQSLLIKAEQYYDQQDYQQAMQWFLKATDKGNAKAMTMIGILHDDDLGVKQNKQQAMQWYIKAKQTELAQQTQQ